MNKFAEIAKEQWVNMPDLLREKKILEDEGIKEKHDEESDEVIDL